jgi:hypothetical protein
MCRTLTNQIEKKYKTNSFRNTHTHTHTHTHNSQITESRLIDVAVNPPLK